MRLCIVYLDSLRFLWDMLQILCSICVYTWVLHLLGRKQASYLFTYHSLQCRKHVRKCDPNRRNNWIAQNAEPYEFCFFLLLLLVGLLTVSIEMLKLGQAYLFLCLSTTSPLTMLMFVGQQKAGTMYYILW